MNSSVEQVQLNINEIFFSLQGEGTRQGLPCVFVRLHGCRLRCSWCDTPYALDHRSGGTLMSFDDIRAEIGGYACRFIEFTGGEPLEQPAVNELMASLADDGYTVAVETGGHVAIDACDDRVICILDLKAPDSGMARRNRWENIAHLKPVDEVKVVCASVADYEWARDVVRRYDLPSRVRAVILTPAFGLINPIELAERILEDGLDVRLQIQLHKVIWDPQARGV